MRTMEIRRINYRQTGLIGPLTVNKRVFLQSSSRATFSYTSNRFTLVTLHGGALVTVTQDGSGHLTKITNAEGGLRTFTYNGTSHRLESDQKQALASYTYGSEREKGSG